MRTFFYMTANTTMATIPGTDHVAALNAPPILVASLAESDDEPAEVVLHRFLPLRVLQRVLTGFLSSDPATTRSLLHGAARRSAAFAGAALSVVLKRRRIEPSAEAISTGSSTADFCEEECTSSCTILPPSSVRPDAEVKFDCIVQRTSSPLHRSESKTKRAYVPERMLRVPIRAASATSASKGTVSSVFAKIECGNGTEVATYRRLGRQHRCCHWLRKM
jgi:hypothetical protein